MSKLSWSFGQVWNQSLEVRDERKYESRGHVWASELGKSMVDRWYKMNGHEPSNPPNARSLRKFEAGNVFEWIVEMVLTRAGVLIDKQEWVKYEPEGLPYVTGKLDHLAGGEPDWRAAEDAVVNNDMPEFMKRAAKNVVKHFRKNYPDGMKPIVLEIKSVSSFMSARYQDHGVAELTHELQLFHYLLAKDMPEGHIIYISKDDLMLTEIGVFRDTTRLYDAYHQDLKDLKEALASDDPPQPEPDVIFDPASLKIRANWKVGYSPYLTLVYGYKDQGDFEDKYKSSVAAWNRVIGRMVAGKNMTPSNESYLLEIKEHFPDIEELVAKSKSSKSDE